MTYEIVVAERSEWDQFKGTRTGNWSNNVGDANAFDTVKEAKDTIQHLRKLGDEWTDAEMRVRVIGEQWPL